MVPILVVLLPYSFSMLFTFLGGSMSRELVHTSTDDGEITEHFAVCNGCGAKEKTDGWRLDAGIYPKYWLARYGYRPNVPFVNVWHYCLACGTAQNFGPEIAKPQHVC